ncbi:gamma-glutamyltransferase [Conexibacter stalactiti]|uniref:Gamma-glutamyltransferase n=1 Tax=Conexibacter stalactiti TaxID=1940611 RepID=A0ABU4HZ04_9ACTN|nr:gamma-glutamyltransferase [Conexibacter stalactiti]MDW5597289.1 gamma-glutamyltransferase [Conexibacter stalactiti]MEC5037931.1 gamma-glutamyltransferase [Conexibacter stalactiti]
MSGNGKQRAGGGRGVVAAGHQLSAEAGAAVLRDGGNAVDAALAAMLTSFAAEPLLTGLGAGGYMLVVPPGGGEPVLLDFFVEVPGRGADHDGRAELVPVSVSFGDAVQVFNAGAASVGAYGMPHGICAASQRFGSIPLRELVAPAAALARGGVPLNAEQAYVVEILEGICRLSPAVEAIFAPAGRLLGEGEAIVQPELAASLELLADEGVRPFYEGEVAAAVTELLSEQGGLLTGADLAAYATVARAPVRTAYRGREVLSNPPPSAGGTLIAYALALLEAAGGGAGGPTADQLVAAMGAAQEERTPEFLDGLAQEGFLDRFLAARLGSTTHVSVLDGDGGACSVTCSNGEGAGIVVPGTGIHLNNMLGEQDLNPLGFHRFPPGRRLPSMMSPTVVLRDGRPELVLGSAGSNRIRSAVLQTIVAVVDHGLAADAAVRAPRVHYEDGIVYAEPGAETAALEAAGHTIARFRALNLFFGGVQAVERDSRSGALSGGGDPRRGGAAVVA